jgi:RimJ/RimL family protein N-acetyltransferase
MPDPIATDRLLLRPFTLDDAAGYWPLVALPDVLRYLNEAQVESIDKVRELLLARPLRDYSLHGYGRLACIEKTTGRLVGFCGLKFVEELGQVDLGYRFLPDCWGKGYASESAAAVMDHGRNVLALQRIIGMVMPGNQASARVLVKLGMRYESQTRPPGCEVDLDLYAWNKSSMAHGEY